MNRIHAPQSTSVMLMITFALAASLGGATLPAADAQQGDQKTSPSPTAEEWNVSLRLPASMAISSAPSPMSLAARAKSLEDGTTLLKEDFESEWPVPPWRTFHEPGFSEVMWGRTDYRAAGGSFGLWCAASGPASPGPGGLVPIDSSSWVTAGPFDLSDALTVDLSFDLWLNTEKYYDIFMWLVSNDGIEFTGQATSTNSSGWERRTVSLNELGGGGAIGSDQVWIAFVYTSDRSNTFEGAYLDNVLMVADAGEQGDEGYTYTTDEDFEFGTMIGAMTEDDTLQLSSDWDSFPFLWVPNTNSGTISRVDVLTGDEVAAYRTGPPRDLEPMPIAVDLEGACWVGNRAAGTVVKIGLEDNGGCVDSNEDGTIDTSRDDDGNGVIDISEILTWGSDECVLLEVVLAEGLEGVYLPGTIHDRYRSNNLLAVAIDSGNDVWAGVSDSRTFYQLDGNTGEVLASIGTAASSTAPTGAVVDSEGILWSAAWPNEWVLKIDPATGEQSTVELSHGSRGLALDKSRHLFVTGDSQATMSRIDLDSEEVDLANPVEWSSNGVKTTENGDVWVAAPDTGNVTRFSNQVLPTEIFDVPNGPVSVACDTLGKVWVVGIYEDLLVRIDPVLNLIDLETTAGGGGGHIAAGDMTGIVARNITTRIGTWTVTYDSLLTDMEWGTLTWVATEPVGTDLTVRARSSNGLFTWSPWETATSDLELSRTPPGRYLEIQVSMQQVSGNKWPTLDELTVTPAPQSQSPDASFTWSPGEPTAGDLVQFTDTSTENPTSWSWSFGDDSSSTNADPSHTYTTAGTYVVTLVVSNEAGTDSISQNVTIAAPIVCTLECSASAPTTGLIEEALRFESSARAEELRG